MINKFRVWDKVSEEYQMPNICLSISTRGELITCDDNLVVEAYAQCEDNRGVELFVGDIVSDKFHRFIIIWTDDYGFRKELVGDKGNISGLQTMNYYSIIGTIHDKAVNNEKM